VHGIGNQFRYSTIQAVTSRFASYCERPITQPLGAFHPDKVILEPDSPELGAYLFDPSASAERIGVLKKSGVAAAVNVSGSN
jgi:hypothetical protein